MTRDEVELEAAKVKYARSMKRPVPRDVERWQLIATAVCCLSVEAWIIYRAIAGWPK